MTQVTTFASLDSLLNEDLGNLADLAGFSVPNNGHYKLAVTASTKEINSKPAVVFDYEVLEVMEMADATATPPVIGDKFGEAFFIDNEFGVGQLKKSLAPYGDAFGTTNIGALLEQIQGVSIYGTVKRRIDKKDETKIYASVSNAQLA